MAVKAINDTAGPDDHMLTLMVFGAFSRMSEIEATVVYIETKTSIWFLRKKKIYFCRKFIGDLRRTSSSSCDILYSGSEESSLDLISSSMLSFME